jgi:hypothetical protein
MCVAGFLTVGNYWNFWLAEFDKVFVKRGCSISQKN